MTLTEIMTDLQSHGNEGIKKILIKHGVLEPLFGVKVEHLKIIQKKIKIDYHLSLALYDTNNADAMYLAGLIADDKKMTKQDLQGWAERAVSRNISAYTVPWVAAGGNHGFELALQWIDSDKEHIAVAGWATLSGLVAIKTDNELNLQKLKNLITRVEKKIHTSRNGERLAMNGFLISIGCYIESLTKNASDIALKIGPLSVEMNGTACKVPNAAEYIKKVTDKGLVGKKKKTIKC